MAIKSTTKINEGGTAVVSFTLTDEDDAVAVPNITFWTLLRTSTGDIVNSRDWSSLVGSDIVLTGDDLALFKGGDDGKRTVGIRGTYDSSAGDDLNFREEIQFSITDLVSKGND